ncbi:response regulator [Flavobacterium album]|uniref:Response regulator n=1 Tax=Flavobacterium album TaxID=2175091 RepID=A0A2S1R1N5_9FLAO|nr:response regulator [Flavobacterium album]AWH86588.1 response regulator [Flavobacterium album]
MSQSGAVVIVEDDMDDRIFLSQVFKEINMEREVLWFSSTSEAFEFLKTTSRYIFLIFSDIQLPAESGLEFKQKIDANPRLRRKSIPFVFYSTSASQRDVDDAYTKMTIQGFFQKLGDYDETKMLMKTVFDYWDICKHPNKQ